MEKRVFSDDEVAKLLEQFVPVKVDGRADPGLAREVSAYKSTRFVPEVVFLSPRKKVLGRLQAKQDPVAAAQEIRAALDRNKQWSSDG